MVVASFCLSLSSTVWTADRFALRTDGKEDPFVLVVRVLEIVSCAEVRLGVSWKDENNRPHGACIPLFSAPQQSQVKMVLTSPVEASRRLPHSVQKTRDPIADILSDLSGSS